MSKLSDRHYKEKQPEETVGQIQKILKNLEINVTENGRKKQHWNLCTAVKDRKYGYRCERKGNQ